MTSVPMNIVKRRSSRLGGTKKQNSISTLNKYSPQVPNYQFKIPTASLMGTDMFQQPTFTLNNDWAKML